MNYPICLIGQFKLISNLMSGSVLGGAGQTIYTEDKEYFCSFLLTKLIEILDPNLFIRVHRSYIINFNYAEAFERVDDHGTLVLKSEVNQSVPVSRSKVAELRRTLDI